MLLDWHLKSFSATSKVANCWLYCWLSMAELAMALFGFDSRKVGLRQSPLQKFISFHPFATFLMRDTGVLRMALIKG